MDDKHFYSESVKHLFRAVMDPINMFRTQSFIDPALMDPPRAEKTFLQLYGEKVVAKGIKSYANQMYRLFFSEAIPDKEICAIVKKQFPRKPPLPSLTEVIRQSESSKRKKSKEEEEDPEKPTTSSAKKMVYLSSKQLTDLRDNLNISPDVCISYTYVYTTIYLYFIFVDVCQNK